MLIHTMNNFGERQHPEKFVPKTVQAILKNEKVILHGQANNTSSRCWLHARNLADALIFLLFSEKVLAKEIFNIAGEEAAVETIANFMSQIIRGRQLYESEKEYIDFHSCRKGHDFRYALNDAKIRRFGWKQKLDIWSSLENVTRWMVKKENLKWLRM